MAPSQDDPPKVPAADRAKSIGPHPSHLIVAKPMILEKNIQKLRTHTGVSEAKDDVLRLNGCAWIDNVRCALDMPVRTYCTATVLYHKFRLMHNDSEYNYQDAAAAALFTAAKIEDTLKKSREILCAAYNLKATPAEFVTSDDPMFEQPSRLVLGLERLMLESSAFDFRSRQPHKLIVKLAKFVYNIEGDKDGRHHLAFEICMDIHRTFSCLKSSTSCMAMASLELAGRLAGRRIQEIEEGRDYKKWNTNRVEIMECMRDLLELYTTKGKETKVGPRFALEQFINIRIELNQEAEAKGLPRYKNNLVFPRYRMVGGVNGDLVCDFDPSNGNEEAVDFSKKPKSIRALAAAAASRTSSKETDKNNERDKEIRKSKSSSNGDENGFSEDDSFLENTTKLGQRDTTVRFMLDGEKAVWEKAIVNEYFNDSEEEFEYEVEEEWDHKYQRWVEVQGSQKEVPGSAKSLSKGSSYR